jgi:hypothetical protein
MNARLKEADVGRSVLKKGIFSFPFKQCFPPSIFITILVNQKNSKLQTSINENHSMLLSSEPASVRG